MNIDTALIDRLATLAKLEFDEAGKQAIQQDLENILGFFEQISALDTENVEPLVYVSEEKNVFRPDQVQRLISKKEGLRNAPLKDEDYIKVPKVIG